MCGGGGWVGGCVPAPGIFTDRQRGLSQNLTFSASSLFQFDLDRNFLLVSVGKVGEMRFKHALCHQCHLLPKSRASETFHHLHLRWGWEMSFLTVSKTHHDSKYRLNSAVYPDYRSKQAFYTLKTHVKFILKCHSQFLYQNNSCVCLGMCGCVGV